jgi:hypothetical protein
MMPAERFTTKVIAREVRLVHSGTTAKGQPYEVYQVIATKPDGTQILWPDGSGEIPLRTFDANFPTNEVVEVDAEIFRSEQYGDSYTLKVKGKQGGQTAKKLKELEDEFDKLRARVAKVEQTVGEILRDEKPTTAAAPPPAPPPPPVTQGFNPVSQSMSSSGPPSGDPPPF